MHMQINHSLVLAVVSLGVFAHAAPGCVGYIGNGVVPAPTMESPAGYAGHYEKRSERGCGSEDHNQNLNQNIENNQNINAEVATKEEAAPVLIAAPVEPVAVPVVGGGCGGCRGFGGCGECGGCGGRFNNGGCGGCGGQGCGGCGGYNGGCGCGGQGCGNCGGCGGCGGCDVCQRKRSGGCNSDNDNQNINQLVNANMNLLASLPVSEFFGEEGASGESGSGSGAGGFNGFEGQRTPAFQDEDQFNVINDVKFSDTDGFFKRSFADAVFQEEDQFNVINHVTFADRENQGGSGGFSGSCSGGCPSGRCSGGCGSNGNGFGATTGGRGNCNREGGSGLEKRQGCGCEDHNQNINQNIENNQNVNAELLTGGGGFKNFGSFLPFLGKRELGLVKDTIFRRGCGGCGSCGPCQKGSNQSKNININKNHNQPQATPIEICTTEYVPIVEQVSVCVPVPTTSIVTEIERIPYTEFVVTYPTPTAQPQPVQAVVNNYISAGAEADSGADADAGAGAEAECEADSAAFPNVENTQPLAEVVEPVVVQNTPTVDVVAPCEHVVNPAVTNVSGCGCDNNGGNFGNGFPFAKRDNNILIEACCDQAAPSVQVIQPTPAVEVLQTPPKVNVIRPVEVVQPVVTPVDVIQPVTEVIQPVVNKNIRPVYSEVINAPVINTNVEPCVQANNGGYNNDNINNGNGYDNGNYGGNGWSGSFAKRQTDCGGCGGCGSCEPSGSNFGGDTINSGSSGNGGSGSGSGSITNGGLGGSGSGDDFGGDTINSGNSGNSGSGCGGSFQAAPQPIQPINNNFQPSQVNELLPQQTQAPCIGGGQPISGPGVSSPGSGSGGRNREHHHNCEHHSDYETCCNDTCGGGCGGGCCTPCGGCGGCETCESGGGANINENININNKRQVGSTCLGAAPVDNLAIHRSAGFATDVTNLELTDFVSKAVYKSAPPPLPVLIETVQPVQYVEEVQPVQYVKEVQPVVQPVVPVTPVQPVDLVEEIQPIGCEAGHY